MWNLHFDGLACFEEAERGGDTTGSSGRDRAHRRLVAAAQLKEARRIVALADSGDYEFCAAVKDEAFQSRVEEIVAERQAIADLAMSEFLASEAFLADRAAWNAWHDPERVLVSAEARWAKPESKEPDVFQCSMGG